MGLINRTFFTRKKLLTAYFIFFIILNILDFFNKLQGDLDFFKKILSWCLIGYIFYKVSLSKIFIGQRIKSYDIGFIIAFCFFAIPKSLIHYINLPISQDITYLNWLLDILIYENSNLYLEITFLIGLLSTIILSLTLLLNNKVYSNSFIGSFKFKETYFKYIFQQTMLTFMLIFFGLIIFTFFMEWFALAVDALILIIGLLYYIILYIHNHTENQISNLLQSISNSGNQFYQNLILFFSNKKTIFIGISFILTLHLLVDLGVFMVPYTFGTQDTLYISQLDAFNPQLNQLREHTPIFNFYNFKESLFYKDIAIFNYDIFLTLSVFIVYIASMYVIVFLMILPFFIFFNNIKEKKLHINKNIIILFLSSFMLMSYIFLMKGFRLPINISKPLVQHIKGVDIYTNSVIYSTQNLQFNLLIGTIIFFLSLIILSVTFNKIKLISLKIVYTIIIIFFIAYIGIFYTSTIENEYQNLNLNKNSDNINIHKYHQAIKIYQNESLYKDLRSKIKYNYKDALELEIIPFSNLKTSQSSSLVARSNHSDYLYIKVLDYDSNQVKIKFNNLSKVYIKEEFYDNKKQEFIKSQFDLIYYIGNNYYELEKINDNSYRVTTMLSKDIIDNIFTFYDKYDIVSHQMTYIIENIRLIFTSLFYIIGSFAFVLFYIKKNIFDIL